MSQLMRFMHRRPLAVSIFAFFFSLASLTLVGSAYEGFAFDCGAVGVCLLSLSVSFIAVRNTAKAEKCGYLSKDKASISAVAAALSWIPGVLLMLRLLPPLKGH